MTEENRVGNILDDTPIEQQAQIKKEQAEPKIASVTERFLALLVDFGVIANLYGIFVWFVGNHIQFSSIAQIQLLMLGVNIPFVLYMALFSCGGRSTLGKKLVGIQVVDAETAEPLGFVAAFKRSVGYYVSALLLMCGFLLAFIDDKHRALHDYFGHSIVIQSRYKTTGEKLGLMVTGLLLMAGYSFYFYTQLFGSGSYAQKQMIKRAEEHLKKIAYLEDLHYKHYGAYTNDLLRLSILSGDPVQFQRDTQAVLHRKDFYIGVTKERYKLKARAKDNKKTVVYWPNW